ncbi:zinc-ribbon domain-containing protein [Candidatus Bathyarchaeota archaeon]|nr:zinc-ribbon domain-containing protein [Candidatus Bathyarchaeota archaeon]
MPMEKVERTSLCHLHAVALLAFLIFIPLAACVGFFHPLEEETSLGHLNRSQAPQQLNADITIVNFSAPNFTWLGPVLFMFNIDSNVSETIELTVFSDGFDPEFTTFPVVAGINQLNITASPALLATPGYKQISFTFTVGSDNATLVHEIWVGSSLVIVLVLIAVTVLFSIVIIVKYKDSSSVSSLAGPGSISLGSSSASTSPASPGMGSSAFPDLDEDDTSTMTYVDQSRAPEGQIFCPECKKLIEEGSIFCPECGTRIPRYLRYRPDH